MSCMFIKYLKFHLKKLESCLQNPSFFYLIYEDLRLIVVFKKYSIFIFNFYYFLDHLGGFRVGFPRTRKVFTLYLVGQDWKEGTQLLFFVRTVFDVKSSTSWQCAHQFFVDTALFFSSSIYINFIQFKKEHLTFAVSDEY